MTTPINTRLKNRTGQRWLVAVLLASFIFSMGAPGYSNAKLGSAPVSMRASVIPRVVASQSLESQMVIAASGEAQMSAARNTGFAPFLHIVPDPDGTAVFVSAGGIGELGGTVFVNIEIGPGHNKGSYTMTYSDTVQSYIATVPGFTPYTSTYGPLSITTTLGFDTGAVDFNRAYVPASTIQSISSTDGNLQLTLASTDTIPFDTYVAVVPSIAPPGPAPQGHRFVGSAYSVRAAGALLFTDKPMNLRLYYSEVALAGADPHTLAIIAWDAHNECWNNLGGRLFYDQEYLSVATARFRTYALVSTPVWHDDFDDFSGLDFPDEVSSVTLGGTPENRMLVLVSKATSGSAVSKPITPTTAIASWGSLTFTRTVDPPTTTLTVDVLALDGTAVLTDVASEISLASLDPARYPALKLRAHLSSTVAGKTPALDQWRLTWQVEEHRVYLPIVLR